MDLNFPRPMLNTPAESGNAAGNAFYRDVQRRVEASRESNKLLGEMGERRNGPDYAEIVNRINICISEIRPRLDTAELTQMLQTTPIAEIEMFLTKLQKMRPPVQ